MRLARPMHHRIAVAAIVVATGCKDKPSAPAQAGPPTGNAQVAEGPGAGSATGCDPTGSYRFRFTSNGHSGWWFRFSVAGSPPTATLVEPVGVLALGQGPLTLNVDPATCTVTVEAKSEAVGDLVLAVTVDAKAGAFTGTLTRSKAHEEAEKRLAITGVLDAVPPKAAACVVPGIYKLELDAKTAWTNPDGDKSACDDNGWIEPYVRIEPFGQTLAISLRKGGPPYEEEWGTDALTRNGECEAALKLSTSEFTLDAKLLFAGAKVTGTASATQQVIHDGDNGEEQFQCDAKNATLHATRVDSPAGAVVANAPITPVALAGMVGKRARDVEAALGKPTYDLGGSEGEGCFVFERAPDHKVCFSLETEQAEWPQVRKANFEVNATAPITAVDKTGPTVTKL